ncbi:TonB-dependent receptor plug domain-containing protein [Salinivibrio socompensis]|uniref:TonB-dependent receptor plug domain-containing protein n=1 Tax=Salinivibrio socompensis TaxID=1510206 RepID=UPI0004703FFE|nr:Plug domain-containing protein [Salinivibrio socompensis]
MHLRLNPLTVALVIAGSFSFSIHAQEQQTLDTVTVTADSLSGNIAVTDEQLEARQAQDLEDIFRDTVSMNVGGGVGAGQKVYLRGIEDTNLNITVDGAAQGGYLFHHQGRLNIEPELLKRVGVESGPASADNGPGALRKRAFRDQRCTRYAASRTRYWSPFCRWSRKRSKRHLG